MGPTRVGEPVKSQQLLVFQQSVIGVGSAPPWHSCGPGTFGAVDVQTEPDSSMAMHTSTVLSLQVGAGVGYGVGCGVGIGLCVDQSVSRRFAAV